jgi:hypothetical protein
MISAYKRDICIPKFIVVLLTTAKIQESVSTVNRYRDEENMAYPIQYCSVIKNNENERH